MTLDILSGLDTILSVSTGAGKHSDNLPPKVAYGISG